MKATGLGFELPLNEFRISLGDPITVEQHVDDRQYNFKEFFVNDGYRYACCSVNDDIGLMEQVDLANVVKTCQ